MTHKVLINFDATSTTPLYKQLAEEMRVMILKGHLRPGERVPSIQDLSRQLQVSAVTVRSALDELGAEGLVESRKGSGNFVALDAIASDIKIDVVSEDGEPVTWAPRYAIDCPDFDGLGVHVSNEARHLLSAFTHFPYHPWWTKKVDIDLRAYKPSGSFMVSSRWKAVINQWLEKCRRLDHNRSDLRGLAELRKEIASWLSRTRQLECSADDIFICEGAQAARDTIARLTVSKGSRVAIEEPVSINDCLAYASKGVEIISVLQDDGGIVIEELEKVKAADLLHIIPASNFPTGTSLHRDRAEGILDWAVRTNAIIVEDFYGGDFYYEDHVPFSLFALNEQRTPRASVFHIGTLTQLLTPSLRIGYIVAPRQYHRALEAATWLNHHNASPASQLLAAQLLNDSIFVEYLINLMNSALHNRNTLLGCLEKWPANFVSYKAIKCGFNQSLFYVNENIDDLLVFERALTRQVGVLPLSRYYKTSKPRCGLSLNFLNIPQEQIATAMESLLDISLSCVDAL